jgi:UDP-N-acetyl-D-mannosaminuronic acid dehydrogenase
LRPEQGVGGHCIAVDPWFIAHSAPERPKLIASARRVNDAKPGIVLRKIVSQAARIKDCAIACLGLSFKELT